MLDLLLFVAKWCRLIPSVTSGGQAWRVIMTIKSDDAKTTKEKAIKTTPVLN